MKNEIDPQLLIPIPLIIPSVDGWKEIPIQENHEPLVPLGPFSENDTIFTSSIYAGEKSDSPYFKRPLKGSLVTVFVRESVAEKLKTAQSLLPSGMRLAVVDAYRPLEVQQAAFDFYLEQLRDNQPDWEENKLLAETQKYVSIPSTDPKKPSPHNTGGAVDVVILQLEQTVDETIQKIDKKVLSLGDNWQYIYKLEMQKLSLLGRHGIQLNFGTHFDWGGGEAALSYLENLAIERDLNYDEYEGLVNRRLLYNAMTESGFLGYEHEWWHFNDPKTQMGTKSANLPYAEYGAIELSTANRSHENMRTSHLLGSGRVFERQDRYRASKIGITDPYLSAVLDSVSESGDVRYSTWQQSAIIAP